MPPAPASPSPPTSRTWSAASSPTSSAPPPTRRCSIPGSSPPAPARPTWNGASARASAPCMPPPSCIPSKGEPYNVALIDMDEGYRMMSRVEDIAPTEVKIGMRVKVPRPPRRGRRTALPRVHPGGGRLMTRPATRQRRHRRRRGIRYRRRRRAHEPDRPDGPGHPPRPGRRRADAARRGRAVLRHHPGPHLGHVAGGIPGPAGRLHRLHHRRRLVVRDPRRPRPGRAGGRAVLASR